MKQRRRKNVGDDGTSKIIEKKREKRAEKLKRSFLCILNKLNEQQKQNCTLHIYRHILYVEEIHRYEYKMYNVSRLNSAYPICFRNGKMVIFTSLNIIFIIRIITIFVVVQGKKSLLTMTSLNFIHIWFFISANI